MSGKRVKVSAFAHFYTWLFIFALFLWPLFALAIRANSAEVQTQTWVLGFGVVAITIGLFFYAWIRCSSERLSYWDGLLVVSASMMTGWVYNTIVVLLPALLYTFIASVYFSVIADTRYKTEDACVRFHKLVYRMYQKRMRQ
jgi:hypothetical protein